MTTRSLPLAVTTVLVVLIGVLLPITPLAATFGFVPLPGAYFALLGGAYRHGHQNPAEKAGPARPRPAAVWRADRPPPGGLSP